jgi:hypothetical protein
LGKLDSAACYSERSYLTGDIDQLFEPSLKQPSVWRLTMRSELIFSASLRVPNRFLLCRMVSLSTGRLHRNGDCMAVSINKSLDLANQADVDDRSKLNVPGKDTANQIVSGGNIDG